MTKTDIANIALAKFREGRITNIESTTDPVAVVMNDQYDHALELVLEEHRWNFAGKRVTLTQLSDDPPFGWDHQYALPSDLIRLKDVNGEDVEASSQLFALEGKALLTNDDKVTITYVARVTDTNLFSPSFVEALSFKLASITCARLTGDSELAIALDKQYNYALSKAIHNDTKAAGSRDRNLMQRMLDSSPLLGGSYRYPSSGSSSGGSTSGTVAAHKHELTDLLQTGATDGQHIVWNDTDGVWEAADISGGSPLTTKGDIYTYGTAEDRLPVGTDGQFLKADSTEATGLKWVTASGTGDLLAANNLSELTPTAATARTNLGLGTAATNNTGDFATASHTHSTADVISGKFANARISEANVTQHQGALSVTASQVSDFDTEVSNNTSVAANTAKVSNVTTNLGYIASPTDGTVTSSDGTDATVTLADGTNAGLLAPADFTKLGNQSGTNTGDQDLSSYQLQPSEGAFADGDKTKLDGIEASADVTDEANVTSALSGATITDAGTPATDDKVLIQDTSDSDNLKYVNISDLPSGGGGGGDVSKVGTPVDNQVGVWTGDGTIEGDTALTFNGSTLAVTGDITVTGTVDGVDIAGRDHDEVSIAASGGRDYVTISGNQQLTLHAVDLTADVSGDLPITEGGTGASDAATARTNLGVDPAGTDNSVEVISIACSDETTDLTTGTAKATFRMPFAMTLTEVRASVTTAPTGSTLIVDINESGSTIMTTNKLSIDATEKTSETAATAPSITDSSLADDAEITVDIDQVGSTVAGAGLKIYLIGTRA